MHTGFSQPVLVFVCTKWGLSGDLYLSPLTPCCGCNETLKEELDGKMGKQGWEIVELDRERHTLTSSVHRKSDRMMHVAREKWQKLKSIDKNESWQWKQKVAAERKKHERGGSWWTRNRKGTAWHVCSSLGIMNILCLSYWPEKEKLTVCLHIE